jgi:hypothetical protein
MGDRERHRPHQRSLAGTRAGRHATAVPLPHPRFSLRSRQRLHNQTVARLLNKLLIEQTKSRPRHSNHNGLVETKNGAVIRKHRGYGYLHAEHPEPMQEFDRAHWNPYLNYHRPCAQAEIQVDEKGRQPRLYRRYPTPLETVRSC